jgi:hypothetical protein
MLGGKGVLNAYAPYIPYCICIVSPLPIDSGRVYGTSWVGFRNDPVTISSRLFPIDPCEPSPHPFRLFPATFRSQLMIVDQPDPLNVVSIGDALHPDGPDDIIPTTSRTST